MSDSSPLVSVVMPAYNAERHLPTAIKSLLAQSYQEWELLLVNDASRDGTLEVARSFELHDGRIKVIDSAVNRGVSATRNAALERAEGKYIAFLDSDDVWHPQKLEKQIPFMEKENVLISYGWYQRIDEHGKRLGEVRAPARIGYEELLKSNFIGNLTGVYNAQALGKEYFTDYRHEDYVAWLSLIRRAGEARGIPELLGMYRVYAGSLSSNKLRTLGWQWRIYREHQSLSFLQACRYMLSYGNHALYKRL